MSLVLTSLLLYPCTFSKFWIWYCSSDICSCLVPLVPTSKNTCLISIIALAANTSCTIWNVQFVFCYSIFLFPEFLNLWICNYDSWIWLQQILAVLDYIFMRKSVCLPWLLRLVVPLECVGWLPLSSGLLAPTQRRYSSLIYCLYSPFPCSDLISSRCRAVLCLPPRRDLISTEGRGFPLCPHEEIWSPRRGFSTKRSDLISVFLVIGLWADLLFTWMEDNHKKLWYKTTAKDKNNRVVGLVCLMEFVCYILLKHTFFPVFQFVCFLGINNHVLASPKTHGFFLC